MESMRSSRRHGRREEASLCLKSDNDMCGLCLVGNIIPHYCTTILGIHCFTSNTTICSLVKRDLIGKKHYDTKRPMSVLTQ